MKQLVRRKNALARLEAQLQSGVKARVIRNIGNIVTSYVVLSDKDKERINKEILILKERVK